MKKILVLILIIAIGALSYYFYNQNNTQVSTELYEYVKIEKGNIKKVVSATGKIIPTSTLILSSEISGKIVEIKKDYNEKINKADVLAIFDQNPFILNVDETETSVEISKSKLKQKNASLEKAKSELNNSISNKKGSESKLDDFSLYLKKLSGNLEDKKALYKNKFISKKEYEDALFEYESAIFQYSSLESDILSLNAIINSRQAQIKIIDAEIEEVKKLIEQTQLKLESEKLDLSKTKIVSPIDGFILDRHISVGDVLGAYQKDSIMFTIAETLSKMNIEIFIDESDIGNIKVDQTVEFSTDAFPDRKLTATIIQIRYSPIDDQNVITYEVLASFDNPNNMLLPGMTANVDIIVENKNDILKVKNSALSVKLNQKPKKQSSNGSGWGSGRPSQMQEIMGQLDMTSDQQNKMRGVYPKLGKLRASLEAKNISPEKISKEIQLFIENGLIELLTDEQKNKYFALKESLNVKKVYKLVDGDHQKIDLITGLNSGGYTEIIKGELSEGDEVISKITVETSSKKALRLF
ncbi:efflux RND transporter periplasmic adaptor subunit [Pelagibacteraceae bacterium]|nr:efflux RND transporter periplasmic adaptor subunit [Pelagibacteraceae bacterium]